MTTDSIEGQRTVADGRDEGRKCSHRASGFPVQNIVLVGVAFREPHSQIIGLMVTR